MIYKIKTQKTDYEPASFMCRVSESVFMSPSRNGLRVGHYRNAIKDLIHMKSILVLMFLPAMAMIASCSSGSKDAGTDEASGSKLIEITQEQFDANGMRLGKVSAYDFENIIDCNGYIAATPNGLATISTQIGGLVKRINVAAGDVVKKGDVLCELTSNDFITMQQELSESAAKLKQLKADYLRNKELYDQNIGSEKNFIATESRYRAMKAKYKSLKMQLAQLGLNVKKIEDGNFSPAYPVVAPIAGRVSDVYVNLGQFVEQQQKLMEVVDESELQLRLSVFENDIYYLKPGQTVKFYTINNKDSVYLATLNNISKSIDPDTKTITCLADIEREQGIKFVNNSFIRAGIVTEKQSAPALPNEAFIKSGSSFYVLSLVKKEGDTYYFKKVKVKTGRVSEHFTEIPGDSVTGEILVSGVYNLQVN